MVLTFGTRRNFSICARHKGLVVCRPLYRRLGRPKGRTCLALGIFNKQKELSNKLIEVILMMVMPVAILVFMYITDERHWRRKVERLQVELDKANQKYDATIRGFDPIECEEHHLPGDCPLCGAR